MRLVKFLIIVCAAQIFLGAAKPQVDVINLPPNWIEFEEAIGHIENMRKLKDLSEEKFLGLYRIIAAVDPRYLLQMLAAFLLRYQPDYAEEIDLEVPLIDDIPTYSLVLNKALGPVRWCLNDKHVFRFNCFATVTEMVIKQHLAGGEDELMWVNDYSLSDLSEASTVHGDCEV